MKSEDKEKNATHGDSVCVYDSACRSRGGCD